MQVQSNHAVTYVHKNQQKIQVDKVISTENGRAEREMGGNTTLKALVSYYDYAKFG